jgi:hypothetical protein
LILILLRLTALTNCPGLSNKWGWFIGPLSSGEDTYEIYAAAGQCKLENGDYVGDMSISYYGNTVTVEPLLGYPRAIHYYAGSTELPEKNGKLTAAPGQFDKTVTPSIPPTTAELTYTEKRLYRHDIRGSPFRLDVPVLMEDDGSAAVHAKATFTCPP